MSLERWLAQNEVAVRDLETKYKKKTGGPTGFCHELFVWTFGSGQIPQRGWLVGEQRDIEVEFGIERTLLYIPEDLDPWRTMTNYAKEIAGQPIAVEGHSPDNYHDFHIAAFVWSEEFGAWVVIDTRVPGGKLITNDNGLRDWVHEVFNVSTLQYYHVYC
ncbi:hypothetical protein HY949_05370 [Candidatus Gottesmanbacteria bacterium]|nr:hypothetical protein [Candidatus Gottesmanbacteria bacterium]